MIITVQALDSHTRAHIQAHIHKPHTHNTRTTPTYAYTCRIWGEPVRHQQRRLPQQTHMHQQRGIREMWRLPSWLYQRRGEGLQRLVCVCVFVCASMSVELMYSAWFLPSHTNRTLLLNLTVDDSCSSDADCGTGFYCSSKKVCIKFTGAVCEGISCGMGDGGSCIFSPLE